jgi:hypothetical protein
LSIARESRDGPSLGTETFAIPRWETYESIAETLNILSDPEGCNKLKIGIVQAQQGKLIAFEAFERRFDV